MITTVVLRTSARLIMPLGLVFSVFLYGKGHQTPGGGFVGGLVCAVSILVMRMAIGAEAVKRALPCPPIKLIAIGLTCALLDGLIALCYGLPFLTSNHGYIHLPRGGEFEWASVMLFDLGVYLVIAGVVIGVVDALARESEGSEA